MKSLCDLMVLAESFMGAEGSFMCFSLKSNPRNQQLLFLKMEEADDAGIVYCRSRKKTEDTAEWVCDFSLGLSYQLASRDVYIGTSRQTSCCLTNWFEKSSLEPLNLIKGRHIFSLCTNK